MRYFVILTFLAIAACQSDKHTIVLQPEVGKSYWQKASTISVLKQTIEGQSIDINTEYITDIKLKPKSVEKKEVVMSAQFRDLRFKVQSPFGRMGFDSRKIDSSDFAAVIFSRLNMTPFQVIFQPNGRVKNIDGIDNVMQNAFAAVQMSPGQQQEVRRMLDDVYGYDALTSHLEMSVAVLPKKPVAVGESWSYSAPYHSNVKGFADHTYTLKTANKNGYIIEGKSTLRPDKEHQGQNRYDISGDMQSYFKIEPQTGWVSSGVINMNFAGTIYAKNPDGSETAVPVSMNGKIEIRSE
ncbi:MAG: DUF6263 family protein [Cryomorphaceae bacterium]|nr:DUF6263 family protein [Cryomorphaceae bacterium]